MGSPVPDLRGAAMTCYQIESHMGYMSATILFSSLLLGMLQGLPAFYKYYDRRPCKRTVTGC